ncbi:MAG: hypothetical protein HC908_13080 [Calothrix sp. SM1_7_51]|nr:hypothetical protein [Calothrix sp. SM1_7_51]
MHGRNPEIIPLLCNAESFYSDSDEQRSDVGSYQQGYITNGKTICFVTSAQLHQHWVEIYHSEPVPEFEKAERVIALPLQVSSGKVSVSDLINLGKPPTNTIKLNSGQYTLYLLAFNLGIDEYWEWENSDSISDEHGKPLTDEELKARLDFERYKLVFVPGSPQVIGVVYGKEFQY